MAARANSAALNAALNAYVKNHEYKNLNSAVNNYAFGNYNWKSNRNSRRSSSGYYSLTENKQTRANINMMRNMKLNRMRQGVKTARQTPKNKRLAREARPRTPTPERRRRNAEAAARKANENRRMAAAAERARVARAEKNAAKARIGTVDPAHIRPGVGFRVSAAGKAANGGGQRGTHTPANRAQLPTLNRAPALRGPALEAMRAAVQREVVPVTTAPRPKVHASLNKRLKSLGKKK